MKNILKITFLSLILLLSCKEDDKLVFESVTDITGTAGGLRTIDLISPSIDLNDIPNSTFQVEVEQWDAEDGGLLDKVDIFATFQDFTPDNGDNSRDEVLVGSISKEDFELGPSNLPRTIVSVAAQDLVNIFGLDPTLDIDGGDIFRIRLALNLTDGSVFSSDNLEGNITGPFFNSPFSYPANVVCELDESVFTGDYQLELVSGFFSGFGGSDTYSNGSVTITANSGTQRVIQGASYLPSLGSFSATITFDLICGRLLVPLQNVGTVGCSGNAIQMQTGDNFGTFDPSDDSEFILIFNDEVTSSCGVQPYEVVLRLTKI